MQTIGIIAEFNPFHSGHKHLIDTANATGEAVICVMSGNFVQRGDVAITDKFTRAHMAVECGADLVVELPTPWAMSTAQNFAFGAVSILKALGITQKILFGSECAEIDLLYKTADILYSPDFNQKIREEINLSGETFAKVRSRIIKKLYPDISGVLDNPNDTLAVEYIMAAKRFEFECEFGCVKRIGAAHDSLDTGTTASASLIREHIKEGDFAFAEKFMPHDAFKLLRGAPTADIKRIETVILAKLRMDFAAGHIPSLPDLSEGIENRLITAISKANSYDELLSLIKTKRYPLSRVRRLVLSAFLGIDGTYFGNVPPYIRVLALGEKGQELLKKATKNAAVPIITKVSQLDMSDEPTRKIWALENRASDIYSLSLNPPQKCGSEYYKKIIKL